MKKIAVITLLLVLASSLLKSQHTQIPFEEIKEIADRNAKALWGQAYPTEPIPYYSAQDEIIAYRFNYCLTGPFPQHNTLINDCFDYKASGNRDKQWGGAVYGRILMGAIQGLPPVIERSKSISIEFAEGYKLKEIAIESLGTDCTLERIYYINEVHQWFCFRDNKNKVFIKLFPPFEILNEKQWQERIKETKVFIEPGDYSTEWVSFKNGRSLNNKADSFIPDYELCPFYDWSYGCGPTAAAMLVGWWDYRSIYSGNDFGRLVKYYFKRDDNIEGEVDYQIPWVQRDLAVYMGTDTVTTGSTNFYDIKDGLEDVASIRGYEFDAEDYITYKWTRLKGEIDDNRPLIAFIPNHFVTCVGYNNANDEFISHYTHQGHLVYVHKDELQGVTECKSENNNGQGITLTYPVGDTNYNATGNGEIFYPGEQYDITWDYETTIPSTTSIYLSTNSNGGFVEEVIVYNTDNDGLYTWLIPTGFSSDECRIGIINYNASSDMLAMDGSMGMFTIYDPQVIEELGSSTETTDYNPDYFQFDLDEDAWCAVGIRNMTGNDWKLKLYDDLTYLTLIEESNMPPEISEVDFVVLDGNHLPDHTYGVKVDRVVGDEGGKVRYEGSNYSVFLGTNIISFPTYSVLKMYDVHLVPGYYTFTASTASSGEASIALYNSSGGDFIQTLDDALAISNNGGSGDSETFTVCITTEDDYGFCIWTSSPSSQTWELDIIEEHPGVWEGNDNTNWSNSNNWSLNIVPSLGTDVIIPSGTPYNPYVTEYSFCENITIESGASLRVYSGNLVTGGDMLVKGSVRIYEDQSLTVNGDITWTSTSSEYMENNASINVGEDWTFDYGCSIQMSNGKVRFAGIEHSMIYCRSINSWFNELEIDKFLETALVSYEMTPGLQNLQINGDFNCLVGNFMCPSMMSIIFKGQDLNVTDDFDFNCGAGYFRFEGDANQYLFFNPTSNFNNLVIESSGTVYLQDPIVVDQNVYIYSGILASNSNTIEVGGSWYNDAGVGAFYQSSGIVRFTGYGNRECTGDEFHILELDKTSGELRFPEGVTECDVYDYTQGTIRVNGGSFIANDLEDSGIFGTIFLTAGEIIYHQDESQFIDLAGDLTITDGTFSIYGGMDNSYWPWNGSASLTMSDGILDFVDQGIFIYNAGPWIFTENITGGTIRTSSNFDVFNFDFNPTGGTVELYGPDDAWVSVSPGSNLHNLVIHKSGTASKSSTPIEDQEIGIKENGLKGSIATISGGTVINGNLNVQESSLNLFSGQAKVLGNVNITNNGIMSINSYGELLLGSSSSLLCETGGIFETSGETGNEALIHTESGYFDFKITNGGTIRAVYTLFENMNIYGINITSDGLVDETFPFNNCTFSSGQTGGTYLTIDSDQSLTADGVVFSSNTWGGNSNVGRTVDQGEITFTNFSGDFSGEAFDDDPFGRIHWDDGGREIALTVMLEGPYSGSGMTTGLNNLDFLPIAQPYNTSPWNYSGTESVLNIPNANIIDWVLIEYRDATNAASATSATVIGNQAAFLMNDGRLVDMDGISNLDFPYTINDQLYVVIYHRNHLSVMSAYALTESGGIITYDFTTPSGQAYGAGAQKDLGGVNYGMFSGDANADGEIDELDKTAWMNQVGLGGYLQVDFDLDGQIMNQDKNDILMNNTGNSSQIPE